MTALITGTADTIILITCATPGVTIHYTLDGSSPGPSNPNSRVYGGVLQDTLGNPLLDTNGQPLMETGSFTVAAGTLVRAVAFNHPTYPASSIAAKTIQ